MARETLRQCCISGCDRCDIHGHGMCRLHYWHWWKHGHPLAVSARRQPPECSVPGCHKRCNARDLCMTHSARFYRTGDVQPEKPVKHEHYRRGNAR